MNGLFVVMWYACYVICPLTFIQNLVRMIKKDRTFSLLGLVLSKRGKKGIEATADGKTVAIRTAADLSGVVFGKLGSKYVTMPESTDGHILAVGGAGSGKTAAIAIPTLMTWKGRVFAIDIKGELYEKTRKARSGAQIKVFNPTDCNASSYDPFYVLKHTDDISGEARALALSICPLAADSERPILDKVSAKYADRFCGVFIRAGFEFFGSYEIHQKPACNTAYRLDYDGHKPTGRTRTNRDKPV